MRFSHSWRASPFLLKYKILLRVIFGVSRLFYFKVVLGWPGGKIRLCCWHLLLLFLHYIDVILEVP
jgi:hypothetical protein